MSVVPDIQNIVATATMGTTLHLPTIVQQLPCAEFNSKRFAAVTTRLVWPKTTALFFGSGKVVCTGARTKNAARLAIMKYVQMVQKLGFRVGIFHFEIQNIVASSQVPFPVDLPKLRQEHSRTASYEPGLFPGLVFRPLDSATVFLIFRSGRVVITGAKDESVIQHDFAAMYALLLRYEGTPKHSALKPAEAWPASAFPQHSELHDPASLRVLCEDLASSNPTRVLPS